MKEKQILIILIVIILAVLACLTTYMLVNSHEESFTTFKIGNTCTVDVPNTNYTIEHPNDGVSKYIFESGKLNITHQKSSNNTEIKSINSLLTKNSETIENNIHYDSSTGVYSIFIEDNATGDALIITSTNLDLLKRVANSVKFKKLSNTPSVNNTTDDNSSLDDNGLADDANSGDDSQQQNTPSQQNSNQNNNPQTDTGSSSNSKQQEDQSAYPSSIPWNK